MKSLICTILVALTLCACKQVADSEQTASRRELMIDSAKTAVISWDGYPFDSVNYNATTLTQENLNQIDSLLIVIVTDYNNSLSEGHDDYKIDLRSNDYKKQLVAAINSNGEKEVWVNCLCHTSNESWKSEILAVEDGGPCYFNFKVNLTTNKSYDLGVNGFA